MDILLTYEDEVPVEARHLPDWLVAHGIAGGLDNAATVIAELAWENPGYLADVLAVAPAHSDAAVRRVGWILDEVAGEDGLGFLEPLAVGTAAHPSLLSPHDGRTSDVSARWMLNVNREVEPDL